MTDKWKNICTVAAIAAMTVTSLSFIAVSDSDKPAERAEISIHTSTLTSTSLSSAAPVLPQTNTTTTLARHETTSSPDAHEETMLQAVSFPINLNTATAYELSQLPGIGEVLAGNIISYRSMIGIFTNRNQLLEVEGIGEGRLANIFDMIYIEGEEIPYEEPIITEEETDSFIIDIIDVNTATAEDFECLPGISPELAWEIIGLRAELGGFDSVYELLYVDGMKDEIYISIREYLVCGEKYMEKP